MTLIDQLEGLRKLAGNLTEITAGICGSSRLALADEVASLHRIIRAIEQQQPRPESVETPVARRQALPDGYVPRTSRASRRRP